MTEELTLEQLRTERPDLIQELENQHRKAVRTLEAERDQLIAERDTLLAEKQLQERDAYIGELSQRFPDPVAARPVLAEMWSDCRNKEEVARAAKPVMFLLESMGQFQREPEKPLAEKLLELFPSSGAGRSLSQEKPSNGTATTQPAGEFDHLPKAGGLPVPLS